MHCLIPIFFIAAASAAAPFLDAADTGLEEWLVASGNWTQGTLPNLQDMRSLPDFEFAAKQALTPEGWSFYRLASGQEWSYRNNLDVWGKVQFRPRFLQDVTNLADSIGIELFGYNFSAPFFIAPAANAGWGDPERAELNFVEAAGDEDLLYIPALGTTKKTEELHAVKRNNTLNGRQVIFQHIYTNSYLAEVTFKDMQRAESLGAKAIVWTIDRPGSSTRVRGARPSGQNYSSPNNLLPSTWDTFSKLRANTKLPIILKGIQTVDDALEAVQRGADGLYISNHGGRQLEYSQSPLETAYEIYRNAPELFQKVPILADSGVRSGTDVLKLLALGVRAVGMGRPFMFSNVYGYEGVRRVMQLMKDEIVQDGWNLGIGSLRDLQPDLLNLNTLAQNVYLSNK